MTHKEKEKPEILEKLKCAACGSTNVYSKPYKYKQVAKEKILRKFRRKEAFLFSLDVPICLVCKKKFHKWTIYNNLSILIFIFGISSVTLGIFFLIFHQIFGDIGIQIINFGFLFTVSSLIFRYIIGKIESNPNNYFFYDFVGKVFYVKPREDKDWIPYSLWIKTIMGKK
ncbi:MAG: hypothetical protein HWN81_22250 [Candidatus Lokiarchaeota archaeon]|nr:hypothetical protein [Candidatus Lokiarchaeota archaeon]